MITVLRGEELRPYIESVATFAKRTCYEELARYLQSEPAGKVFILYGLRRTGKTTLMRQAIAARDEAELEATAYIQLTPLATIAELNQTLRYLQKEGVRCVFLDEVTYLKDFIAGAGLLADIYAAAGIHIVLTGTDSLGFMLAQDEQLYDRCYLCHTTHIPYREFVRVLGRHSIDDYICYGGTMSRQGVHYNETTFATKERADEYVDSAISRNIQHALRYYQDGGHFRTLEELFVQGELTSVINRVVEDINHRFTLRVLTEDFTSHDLGLSARNLRQDREQPTDILDRIDQVAFTQGLRKALAILNEKERKIPLTAMHAQAIKEYLDLLDITVDIPVEYLPVAGKMAYHTAIAQSGLRYAQARALVTQLLLDREFAQLGAQERLRITERILSEIRGRMLEDIVLLETQEARRDKHVCKVQFAAKEFDMVVADPKQATCTIYEIKHSKSRNKRQYRHLIDKDKCAKAEFRYGKILGKVVLYGGEDYACGEIEYLNVKAYLLGLGK